MKTPLWLQIKYAKMYGQRQRNWTIKNNTPFLGNFSCPICGDSSSNKTKKRFYIFEKGGSLGCICHNCGYSASLEQLLKFNDDYLYRQLITERFSEFSVEEKPVIKVQEKKIIVNDDWKECLIPAQLAPKAIAYLSKRCIPKKSWNRLYYTGNLKHSYLDICSAIGIEADPEKKIPEFAGIFFPFLDKEKHLTFSTLRNLDEKSKLRYVTIEFAPSIKLFGMESIDEKNKIRVVEGPIDSLCCSNAIATGDAALDRAAKIFPKENLILIPDNESRAPVQLKRIDKFIREGFSVVIFPRQIKYKDLNDMVRAGLKVDSIIEEFTFSGLEAKLRFNTWKQI